MSDDSTLEERERPHALGAINDLVRDDEISRLDLLLQTADGGEGNDAAHAEGAQSGDVGAVGHLVRCEAVVGAVAREEGDGGRFVAEDRDGGGGHSPWRGDVEGGDGGVAFELLEAGAADHGDVDFTWLMSVATS